MLYIPDFYIMSKIEKENITKGAYYKALALHDNGEQLLIADDKYDLYWIKTTDVSVASQPEKLISSMELASSVRNGVLRTAKHYRNRNKED